MIQYQILRTNIKRIVWKTVRRITDEILRGKGFKDCTKANYFKNKVNKIWNQCFPFQAVTSDIYFLKLLIQQKTARNSWKLIRERIAPKVWKFILSFMLKLRENTVKLLELVINSLLTFPYWLNLVFRSAALVTDDRLLTHRLFPVSFLSFAEEALFPGVLVVLLSAALESLLLASPVFPFSLKAKWKRIENAVF